MRHLLQGCFLAGLLLSAELLFAQPAPKPIGPTKSVAELKLAFEQATRYEDRFAAAGRLFAADPSQIEEHLPPLLDLAAGLKAGKFYFAAAAMPAAKECAPLLVKRLSNVDDPSDYITITTLIQMGEMARPLVEKELNSEQVIARRRAAQILGATAKSSLASAATLEMALRDPDEVVRVTAALGILRGAPEQKNAQQLLSRGYREFPVERRREILDFAIAGRQGSPGLAAIVIQALDDEDRALQALAGLSLLDDPMAPIEKVTNALLAGVYAHEQYGLPSNCLKALGALPQSKSTTLPVLERFVRGSDSLNEIALANCAIAKLDPAQVEIRLPAITALLAKQDGYSSPNPYLLQTLGDLGPSASSAAAVLKYTMNREREFFRYATAIVLLKVSPNDAETARTILREGLAPNKKRGYLALPDVALSAAQVESLLPQIQAALESDERNPQKLAVALLLHAGPEAKATLPALQALLQQEEPQSMRFELLQRAIRSIESR